MTYEEITQADLATCKSRLEAVQAELKPGVLRTRRFPLQQEQLFLRGRIREIGENCSLEVEARIVWLEDIERYDYVRVIEQFVHSKTGLPKRRHVGHRTVGYANLLSEARRDMAGYLKKRVFFVQKHDRSERPDGVYRSGCPAEAVDPRTVQAGVAGHITDRAAGIPSSPRSL